MRVSNLTKAQLAKVKKSLFHEIYTNRAIVYNDTLYVPEDLGNLASVAEAVITALKEVLLFDKAKITFKNNYANYKLASSLRMYYLSFSEFEKDYKTRLRKLCKESFCNYIDIKGSETASWVKPERLSHGLLFVHSIIDVHKLQDFILSQHRDDMHKYIVTNHTELFDHKSFLESATEDATPESIRQYLPVIYNYLVLTGAIKNA